MSDKKRPTCLKQIRLTGYYCGRPKGHDGKCYPLALAEDCQQARPAVVEGRA